MSARTVLPLLALALAGALPLRAQATIPELQGGLEVKWVRDSEEYAALTRMVYRVGTRAVTDAARRVPRGRAWAVVLDVDETALDNSTYQLTRLTYRLGYDTASWNDFVRRQESGVVPGVVEFVAAVRQLGGRVAWISNRLESVRQPTQANMAARSLWGADDRLCLANDDAQYTKTVRRAELASGTGACGWAGQAVEVLAYVGDNILDFPQAGEPDADAGKDSAFGTRYFMIPNPIYGGWVTRVTRRDR